MYKKQIRDYLETKSSIEEAINGLDEFFGIPSEVDDIQLEMTCSACPEQYDAYYKGKMVGYLRLRHGSFRVDFPTCGGETIYRANPEGDGCFINGEREYYLNQAKLAILNRMNVNQDHEKERIQQDT